MADTSTCTSWRCGVVTPGLVATCPTCGARAVSSRRIRILGGVLIGLGLLLVGLMGAITYSLYPTLTRPGVDISGAGRWTGTAEQAAMVLNLFWIIIGFGALCIVGGVLQIVTGRRNRIVMVLALLGAATILLYGWETTDRISKGRFEEPRRIVQPPPTTPANPESPAPDKPQEPLPGDPPRR